MSLLKKWIKSFIKYCYKNFGSQLETFFNYLMFNFRVLGKDIYFYQPLYKFKHSILFRKYSIERKCDDRWRAIEKLLPEKGSYIDIGSQSGFFVLKMAEKGFISTGFEQVDDAVWISKKLADISHCNAAFFQLDITPDSVHQIPGADVISCMSVFHHWAGKHFDLDYASKIMQVIADKTGKMLVFDTGQSNEDVKWAKNLSFMDPEPKKWIEEFLISLGFKSVHCIGDFDAMHISNQKRHLFAAYK